MKKINLTITGCLGRMGQQIIKSSKSLKDFKIVSVTESKVIKKKISITIYQIYYLISNISLNIYENYSQ